MSPVHYPGSRDYEGNVVNVMYVHFEMELDKVPHNRLVSKVIDHNKRDSSVVDKSHSESGGN